MGESTDSSGLETTLAEAWNGATWSIEATPDPSGAQASSLAAVSCLAGACTAVGESTDGSDLETTLAEAWNGATWSIESTPNPSGAQASSLSGVSCPAAGACTAVGTSTDGTETEGPLAEAWAGGSWSVQSTPVPSGAQNSLLAGVSCTSANGCTAAGEYVDSSDAIVTLAEVWNGAAWSVQTTPDPSGAEFSSLNGVACTPTGGCSAAGESAEGSSYLTLVEVGPAP